MKNTILVQNLMLAEILHMASSHKFCVSLLITSIKNVVLENQSCHQAWHKMQQVLLLDCDYLYLYPQKLLPLMLVPARNAITTKPIILRFANLTIPNLLWLYKTMIVIHHIKKIKTVHILFKIYKHQLIS